MEQKKRESQFSLMFLYFYIPGFYQEKRGDGFELLSFILVGVRERERKGEGRCGIC